MPIAQKRIVIPVSTRRLALRWSFGEERWPIPPRFTVHLARYCWPQI